MSKDVPRLGGSLIVRKGEAAPTMTATPTPPLPETVAPAEAAAAPAAVGKATMPRGIAGTIAVTVRLDPSRYERLKMHGAKRRQTNQEILVAALDGYLAAEPDAW